MRFVAVIAALAAPLAALGLAASARAFVVESTGEAEGDAVADFAAVARWDANEGSLLTTHERGLGGGLEYAIDGSVCTRLVFADSPDCAAIKAQIREALQRWSVGNPSIRFVDRTGLVAPQLAPSEEPWIGHGAEIDFFAAPAADLVADHGEAVAADTRRYYLFAPAPRDPEGRVQTGSRGRITAADVRLNEEMCFHLDPDADAPGCVHFGSVIMHEIAHVLGLDHPDEHPERNLDDNLLAGDPMALGCDAPAAYLQVNTLAERYAVANGRWTGAGYWTRGLTYDDYAGRDALYPDCGAEQVAAASGGARRWAAFALSDGGGDAFGWARDALTQDDARESATEECARYGASCTVAAVFTDCFAMARDAAGRWGWAVRSDIWSARDGAVANCSRNGQACAAPVAMCAAEVDAQAAR